MEQKRISKQNIRILLCLAAVFAVMLVLNLLTHYTADDWVYMLSFSTKEPIRHIRDIFPSMYVHSYRMNGRILSHGLVQLLFLLPPWCFDILNSAVYTLLMYLSLRLCMPGKRKKTWLLGFLVLGFWTLLPAFGEAALWTVGSVNYLWALLFGLLYLFPFVRSFRQSEKRWTAAGKIGFTVFSVLMGMYTEITSFVVLFLSVLLLLGSGKRVKKTWLWFPVLGNAAGYAVLLSMPAELGKKQGSFQLPALLGRFWQASGLLVRYLWPLLLLWLLLAAWMLVKKQLNRRFWLSCIFFLGGLGANYMLIAAAYMPQRCLCTATLLFLLANGLLLPEPGGRIGKLFRAAVCILLTAVSLYAFYLGAAGIIETHREYCVREDLIRSEIAAGKTDLTLPLIHSDSKYTLYRDLRDLSVTDTADWPNSSMAKIYGAGSILGTDSPQKGG